MALCLVLNDTRVDLHHGCDRVMATMDLCLRVQRPDISIQYFAAHKDWSSDREFLGALGHAKLVLVNGEGTLHHNNQAAQNLMGSVALAKAHGLPVAIINASWQDNGPELLSILSTVDLVSVRELSSFNQLKGLGYEPLLVPDLSFYGLLPDFSTERSGKVAITDSVVKTTSDALFGLLNEHTEYLPMFCDHNKLSHRLLLFRRALSRDSLSSFEALYMSLKRAFYLQSSLASTHEDFLARLGQVSGVISGRFHASTIAMGLGVSLLVLDSNSHKVRGLVKELGLEHRIISLDQLSAEVIHSIPAYSQIEKQSLIDYVTQAQGKIERMFERVLGLID